MRTTTAFVLLWSLISFANLFAQKEVICKNFGQFNDGLAPILNDNKWGFIDTEGNIVIQPVFRAYVSGFGENPYFSEGLTPVIDAETEKVGYINKKGEMVIPYQYYSGDNFHEGVAFVGLQNDYVIIDSIGNIIARKFIAINGWHSKFSGGFAGASKNSAYGFIDKTGKFVIEPNFEEVRDFSNGFAAVKKDNKWGFIDTTGSITVPFQFTNEPKPFSNGRAFVQGANYTWGIIDTTGKLLVEPKYKQVFPFNGGAAIVSVMDNKFQETFYVIDPNGKVVKEFQKAKKYNETITLLSGFTEGLAVAMKDSKKGFIDTKGKIVIDFKFRQLQPFSDGLALAELFDEKTKIVTKGFINNKGKMVIVIKAPQF
ncbi:MAG: WG repeat-containing protein [Ignavibacteriaceae bacterium]|jgi:hypothetical protein